MKKIHLYFKVVPRKNRFFYGEAFFIDIIKRIFKLNKTSGIQKVFDNLCLGFNELKVNYDVNLPFNKIKPGEPVVILGDGKYGILNYNAKNPIIAGIGLMTHPSEWPNLFTEYPVAKYLQHSTWANNIYTPFYGEENCGLWPAGIDTNKWAPSNQKPQFDVLIYNKIRWDYEKWEAQLRTPIIDFLNKHNITYHELVYGKYKEVDYKELLSQCKAMIFLCEHESQGIACCEALSTNIPVLAWDQGYCLDPNRFKWNSPEIPATSVPFFDENCGKRFKDYKEFAQLFHSFWEKVEQNEYHPREYVLENISLKKSAQIMLDIINSVYK